MKQPVAVVLSLDQGNLPAGASAAAASLGKIGKAGEVSAKQTAAAMRQLPAQFTDIATQLAGGQNPLLILLQQGGQIKDSFGGVGNALRGVAAAISPVSLVLGGAAAAVGGLAFAAFQGAKETAQLRDTLILTGNAAGLTQDRLVGLAERITTATGQTLSQSRELVLALAGTGQVTQGALESTAKAVARISDLSGKSAAEIARNFAQQLRDPSRFAAELNRQYNFLDVATARRIRALQDEGRAVDAAVLTNEALIEATKSQRQQLGLLEQSWLDVSKAVSSTWEAIKGIGREPTALQAIESSRRDLELLRGRLEREPLTGLGGAPNPGRAALEAAVQRAEFRLTALAEQARQQSGAADAAARRAADSGKVNDILELDAAAKAAARRLADFREEQRRLSFITSDFGTNQASAETERLQRYESVLAGLPKVIRPVIDAQEELKQSFLRSEKAAYEGIDQFLTEQSARAAAELERINQNMRDNIQGAFGDTFTQLFSGQFDSIGQLWRSLLSRMVAEAAAADLSAALFGKGSGGNLSNLFGSIAGLFGGGRAWGGEVRAGRIYEVTEPGTGAAPGELLRAGGRQFLLAGQDGMVSRLAAGAGAGAGSVVVNIHQNIGQGVSRAEMHVAGMAAKEAVKVEMLDLLRRRGMIP